MAEREAISEEERSSIAYQRAHKHDAGCYYIRSYDCGEHHAHDDSCADRRLSCSRTYDEDVARLLASESAARASEADSHRREVEMAARYDVMHAERDTLRDALDAAITIARDALLLQLDEPSDTDEYLKRLREIERRCLEES